MRVYNSLELIISALGVAELNLLEVFSCKLDLIMTINCFISSLSGLLVFWLIDIGRKSSTKAESSFNCFVPEKITIAFDFRSSLNAK